MRRIALFITGTIAALVLLFSYRTSWGPESTPASVAGPGAVGIVSGTTPRPTTSGEPPPKAKANQNDVTVNGTVADTVWGPVQVQVVIQSGRISDVTAIQYPQGNRRDDEINSYALPQLHDQVIAAQSANIDGVSGATVTTDGYIESLQAALDYAHFG